MPDGKLARYRVAIQENFPALPLDSLRYMAEGWDSLVCQVNERLIFRFPKRPEVAERLALETRLLPELAPTLPLPVPQFTYISKPTGLNFPYLFVGYEALPGLTQPDWPEEVAQATWWKADLGDFLTALHAFPIERARKLGVQEKNFPGSNGSEDNWRESLEAFYSLVREQVEPLLSEGRQDQAADYFEDFLDDDRHFSFEPVLLHGDLSGDHVLLDPLTQKVKGIIDFGDVCLGDPAFDVAQSVLPYYRGKVDPTFKQRQLFYGRLALFFAITFGLEHSDPALVEYGLSIINQGGLSLPEA